MGCGASGGGGGGGGGITAALHAFLDGDEDGEMVWECLEKVQHLGMDIGEVGVPSLDDIFKQAPPFLDDCKAANKTLIDMVLILRTVADPKEECPNIATCIAKIIQDAKAANEGASFEDMALNMDGLVEGKFEFKLPTLETMSEAFQALMALANSVMEFATRVPEMKTRCLKLKEDLGNLTYAKIQEEATNNASSGYDVVLQGGSNLYEGTRAVNCYYKFFNNLYKLCENIHAGIDPDFVIQEQASVSVPDGNYLVRWENGATEGFEMKDGAFTVRGRGYTLEEGKSSFTWPKGTKQKVVKLDPAGNVTWTTDNPAYKRIYWIKR